MSNQARSQRQNDGVEDMLAGSRRELEQRLISQLHELAAIDTTDTTEHGVYAAVLLAFERLAHLISQRGGKPGTAAISTELPDILPYVARLLAGEDAPMGPAVSRVLHVLGDSFHGRYQRRSDLTDIYKAIHCYNQAILYLPEDSDEMLALLSNVGSLHLVQFESTGNLPYLDNAMLCGTRAASFTPDGHPHKPAYLSNLGNASFSRFMSLGQLLDLEVAIECSVQAALLTSEEDPDLPSRLANLGNMYCIKYEQLGQVEDLELAIEHHTRAASFVPDNHPSKAQCLSCLGASHLTRYERLGQLPDVNIAVDCGSQVILLTSDGHPQKPGYLVKLGTAYIRRYNRHAHLTDLEMAMECHERAVFLAQDGQFTKLLALSGLGATSFIRYQRLGQLADLDAAINYQSQAASLTPDQHISKPVRLVNLGITYHTRFIRLQQLADLQEATNHQRRAISLVHDSHPDKLAHLSNLGSVYFTWYQHLGRLTDLDASIEFIGQAVSLASNEHSGKPLWLNNLATSHRVRYKHSKAIPDLNLAIDCFCQALSLVPDHHYLKSGIRTRLGRAYRFRYRHLGQTADLDLAIECKRSALSSVSDDHSDRMAILAGLGECFLDRYRRSHSATDVSESAAYFEQAARSQVGDPRDRAGAASQWAVASLKCQPQSSLEAYQYFMSLIPQVVWLGLAAQARYERIADVSKLTLEAATVAIHFQKYEQALEWLDQGRSIVWSQLLQLRQPLDELQNVDPALSEELVLIANELQSATALETFTMSGSEYQNPPEHAAQRHRRLTEKWEELVYRAQSLPGMGDFLAPKKVYQLVVAARTRALVVVIVHEAACNALVIRPGTTDVGCVLLKDLTLEKIAHASNKAYSQNAGRVRTDRKITNAKVDREPSSVLSFLWTSIAKPVLDYLEYTEVLPMEELPHITWCTTGPLSFLPLHAAGDYSKPHCSLSDYAISSYTPTLGTLLARSQESVAFSGLATIGQALTPGFPTLPGTVDELNNISKQAERIQVTRLDGDSATGEAVLDVMERHSWVHLACHASQDLANPTASAFHLHDGPLDLASITRNNLKHADFAFLSACQTATGDKHLSEEAVHLAAGMIMAGYRAVVATLWPIDDRDAPLVADRFYEYMLKDGEPDTKKVARALHYAVGCLRDSVGVEAYWRWAPYIHIGQ